MTLVPGGHPLHFKKRFEVADLAGLPLIEWPHCPLHQSFIHLLAKHGIALTVRASAEREELLLHLAEVPQSHAAHARHAPARPLDGHWPSTGTWAWPAVPSTRPCWRSWGWSPQGPRYRLPCRVQPRKPVRRAPGLVQPGLHHPPQALP